jgi:putative toxin-antitoxin system antitoxin component (TIGR02293 family)
MATIAANNESDRVVRLARLAERAIHVFQGNATTVARWLRTPLRALGDASPLSLVDTDVGTQEALDVLGRLEHGVFS